MELTGIEKALREGCRLHGFRSGGGLRVVRIEQNEELRGYGEHPNVEDALSHANEDFLAGGRPYNKVYGKSKPHYLTGSSQATSPLDHWLLRGNTIDAYVRKRDVVVELKGYAQTETPHTVTAQLKKSGQPIVWTYRGYTFETYQGFHGETTRILKVPEDKRGKGSDAFLYRIIKTGRAKEFFKALEHAFEAEEIEEST